jgi:hypothetical protein
MDRGAVGALGLSYDTPHSLLMSLLSVRLFRGAAYRRVPEKA